MELSGSRCGEGGPPGGRESQREGALENFLPVHGCGCGQFGPDRLSQESKPATSLESLELRTDLAPPRSHSQEPEVPLHSSVLLVPLWAPQPGDRAGWM